MSSSKSTVGLFPGISAGAKPLAGCGADCRAALQTVGRCALMLKLLVTKNRRNIALADAGEDKEQD